MSIWNTLYSIFEKERELLTKSQASKQALTFEIQSNLIFLADAIKNGLAQPLIINGLEHQIFDNALISGYNFNSLNNKKIQLTMVKDFAEFHKYIGKDSQYLIHNAYSKIKSLKKLNQSDSTNNLTLKLKSLFRFLF